MKLGSLFDGSGGFPLAGSLCGIEPVWAAEVEPYPVAVTCSRFPKMKHLGSVTDIHGGKVEPVDIITFGSPCQDLSLAGKRAGLKHEANGDEETTRSGLFMEAVRIIKEMREATNGRYPTFAVWENVFGAFSSNKGEDFRIVLEELIKIVEPRAVMPEVPKNGWPYADSYCGEGWSISYRVFDAKHWGVPQRRRRIYLVLGLRGERARDVLFERPCLCRNTSPSGTPWQAASADAQGSVGADDRERAVGLDGYNATTTGEVSATLGVNCGMSTGRNGVIEAIPYTLKIRSGCEGGGKGALIQEDLSATLATNNDQYLFQPVAYGINGDIAGTLDASYYKGCGMRQGTEREVVAIPIHDKATRYKGGGPTRNGDGSGNGFCVGADGDPMNTLTVGDHHAVCYAETYQKVTGPLMANSHPGSYTGQDAYTDMLVVGKEEAKPLAYAVDCRNLTEKPELYQTLQAKPNGGQSLNFSGAVRVSYIVRRLTPTECARLQGFADRWGDIEEKTDFSDEEYAFWLNVRNTHAAINGKAVKEYTKAQVLTWYNKLHTDSAEYKMWGNGIALPTALYVMEGIAEALMG